MGLRICLVTPFAWSQPHDVNEHVAGVAAELRALGHSVTVLAPARGGFDVVHGFEPGLPSLAYLALRDAQALAVASFFSPERLGYPPGRAQRERLLARVDALIASSPAVAAAAAERFPGDYTVLSPGVDTELFRPAAKERVAVVESRPGERALA